MREGNGFQKEVRGSITTKGGTAEAKHHTRRAGELRLTPPSSEPPNKGVTEWVIDLLIVGNTSHNRLA